MSWSDEYLAQVQAEIDSPNTATTPTPAEPKQALPSAPEQTLPEIPAAPPAREYAVDSVDRLHEVLQTVPVQDEAPAQPAQEQEDKTEDALFEDFSGFSAADFGMERQPEPEAPQTTARMQIQGNPGLRSPEEIAKFDKLAEDLGRPFGIVDADPDDARREAKSLAAESVPNGDRWVVADEQNAAILGDRAGELNAAWQGLEGLKLLQLDNKDKSLRPDWHPKLKDMQEYFDTLTDPVAQSGIPRWWQGGQKAYAIGELQRVRGLLGEELGDLASRAPNLIGEQEKARMQELGEMLDVIDERLRRAGNEGGPLGLFWALQQASRTIKQDIPMAAKAGLAGAGAGAVYGGLAGSAAAPGAGTGIGAAGGAIAGFKAGAAGGFFLSASRSEYGNMVADLRNMKDDAGNPVDLRTIVNVAKGYGIVSGAIETGSEWLGLKALGVGKLATGAARKALGTAAGETGGRVAAAAANKSIGRAVAKGTGAGLAKMGLEGAEEGTQEAAQILMTDLMRMHLSSTGKNYFAPGNRQITLLDQENLQRIGESAVVGAAAGFWMGAAPTILNIGSRVHDANQARAYAEAHTQAAQVIDQNMRQGAQLSPQRTESFLQVAMGMDGNVLLPADAVLELQNEGVNIAGPMGWGEDTLAEAAAEGSDLVVPVARLHARLDPATMGRVAQIMRPQDSSYSAQDAEFASKAIDQDVEKLVADVEQHEADMTAYEQEEQRLRGEIEAVARQRSGLNTALVSSQDTETSVSSYVNTQMQLAQAYARMVGKRQAEDGHTYYDLKAMTDALSRLNIAYQAQRVDPQTQAINDVMREAGVDLSASRTAQRRQFDPEFDAVYGRLDYDSVKEAYGDDFAKELRQEMGPGFFAPKGKGERIENIAENYLRETQGGRDGFMDRVLMGNEEYFSRMANGRLNQMSTTNMLNQMAPELGVTAEELRQEYDAVVNQYQETDQWMMAPNGEQSNLNERQWVLVRTPRFKAWFGDWENDPENSSKVVDENGEPRVTNHGDRYSTDYLEYDEAETDYHGFWSFMDSSETNSYEEGRLLENFLNARKPLETSLDIMTGHPTYRDIIDDFSRKGVRLPLRVFGIHKTELDDEAPALYEFGNEIIPIIKAKGFDAWIVPEDSRKTIAVFDSTQIKSATDNTGAFSPANPNILMQFIGQGGAYNLDLAEEATMRIDNLGVAREMEEAGTDARAIKVATGWERGKDGKWRYEIEDIAADVRAAYEKIVRERKSTNKAADDEYYRLQEQIWKLDDKIRSRGKYTQEEKDALKKERTSLKKQYIKAGEERERLRSEAEKPITLGDLLGQESEVLKAHPLLAEVNVVFSQLPSGTYGVQYEGTIELSPDLEGDRLYSTLLHEIQHAIQDIEGFAKGGNLDAAGQLVFKRKLQQRNKRLDEKIAEVDREREGIERQIHALREENGVNAYANDLLWRAERGEITRKKYRALLDKKIAETPELKEQLDHLGGEIDRLWEERESLIQQKGAPLAVTDREAYEGYRSIAGEVESRNTQARMGMTYEERLNSLASETEDVAREDQIVLRDGLEGGAAAMASIPENPLVAIHNISADNLVKAAQLGGLPVPSIGITKAATPYSDFGEISLIGTRAVGLNEFAGAVVPDNISPEAFETLRDNGIHIETYKANDNAERQAKVQALSTMLSMQGANTLFQTAYHGTPHRFDKFTLDHMGKGEGAQVHGWGLYFAQDRGVAAGYRDRLAGNEERHDKLKAVIIGGKRYSLHEPLPDGVSANVRAVFSVIDGRTDNNRGDDFNAIKQSMLRAAGENSEFTELIAGMEGEYPEGGEGSLFAVDIPENDVLLDEDRTYDEQPEKVKKALRKLGIKNGDQFFSWDSNSLATPSLMRFIESDKTLLERVKAGQDAHYTQVKRLGGGNLYFSLLVRKYGTPEAASKALNAAGIKGITYEGGRDGRCFVVFDDEAISILETYQQNQNQQALGETTINDDSGTYFITLFKGANLSTLTHEMGHVVFKEFQRLVQSGQATESMVKDWQGLEGWLAGLDDEQTLAAEYDKYQKGLYQGADFSQLTDNEKAAVRERARQEWLARGLEQYLREGKAPTAQTEGMFRRFAKWLTRVYRQATQLNVELTDEVRGVFARLIASEEDIEEAAQRNSVEDASSALLDALGLHGAERLSLQGLIQEDKDKAAASLRRQRESIFLRHREQWEEWADEELSREPVYAARDDIRKTPVNWDDFAGAYGEDMARALAKKLPGCISHEGTANAEEVAAAHGYDNAGAMAQAILEAPGKRERKRDIISGYREAAERELDAEDYLWEQEGLAEQQEKIGEFVYRLEAKGRTQGGAPVEGATGRERRAIAKETLRDIAANILAKKHARDACSPTAYRRQAARYMRLEREAILRKDWVAAIDANNKARINLELERQARQNRDVMAKLIKRAKKFLASKSTDPRARYGVYLLAKRLNLFGMNRRFDDNAADKTLDDWHAWTAEMRQAGFLTDDTEIGDALLTGDPQSWWSQTWEELTPAMEALTATIHSERASRQARNEQDSAEWKDYIHGLADGIRSNITRRQKQGWDKPSDLTTMLQKFGASGMNADTIAMALDDDIDLGPVWQAVVKPIRDATWRRNERLRKAGQDVKQLFSVYSKKELLAMRRQKIFIPKLGRALTKEQMLCVLLNCGNADNYQRLLDSPKMDLTPDSIREIIDMLDERDVKFAQSVWDYCETFRKEAFDIEEKLTGVRPHAVEATPVSTKFGELRGGYYPIRYDLDQNGQPVDQEAGGTITTGAVPTVDHGSMMQRAGKGKAAPVSMELDTIPEHVVTTIHMIEFREPVRQVARVLNNAEFDDAVSSTLGKPYLDSLKGWLRFVAGERPPMNQADKVFRWARKNLALMTMGFSLATTIAQTTGLLATLAKLGPRWTFEGLFRAYARGPRAGYQFVMENSAMMRNRIRNTDRDVYEFTTGIMQIGARNRFTSPLQATQDFMAEHGFKMMGWAQMVCCDLPTWHAAYAKRMAETNGNHKEACEYADLQVERTQSGSAEYNQSSWQHGGKKYGEIAKLATPFYTYFGALFQLFSRAYFQIREHHDARSVGRMASLYLLTMVMEPVLMSIILGARPDDDDDEDWAEFLAKSAAKEAFFNPFNMVVGVRDVASAIRSSFDGYGGNYRPIPAADLVNWAVKAVKKVDAYSEGKASGKAAAMATLKAAGYTTGIVNNQEIRLLEAWWNWLDGTTPELEVADMIRKQKK